MSESKNEKKENNKISNKLQEFKEIIAKLDNIFGEGTLQFLDDKALFFTENQIIKSGSYYLDHILGIGGYPKGRIIEIYGAESCGKTTIALKAVAQCQKAGGKVVYIDAEHALDSAYAQDLGVDLDKMVLCQPISGEQTFSIIEALIKAKIVDLIVVDSVAALTPQAELDGEFGDQTIGLQARMMSKGLRIIQSLLSEQNITIIFINQIREKIGIAYGSNTTTSGGRALKFFASLRLETKKVEIIKNADEMLGLRLKVTTVKNKVARPLRTALIDLYFGYGFDYKNEIIDIAINHGLIKKSGSWFSYKEQNLAQGKENLRKMLFEKNNLYEEIKKEVIAQDLLNFQKVS